MRPQAWAQRVLPHDSGGRKLILRFARFSNLIKLGPNGKEAERKRAGHH